MLQDLNKRIIDFRHSRLKVDEEISKVERSMRAAKGEKKAELQSKIEELKKERKRQFDKAEYEFIEKNYIDYSGKRVAKPPYFFSWCRYTSHNEYRDLEREKHQREYYPVVADKDKFAPEGLSPKNGYYIFGDLILVKRPLTRQIQERMEQIKRARGATNEFKKFQRELDQHGAAISDNEMDKFLSSIPNIASLAS